MSKFEFVNDDEQDDQLVKDIAARENELAVFETELERWQHMYDHAADYVPDFGDAQVKEKAVASLRAHAADQLGKCNFQHAKSKAFHGAMKAQEAKRGSQRMQAARTRHAAKVAAEKAMK